MESVKCICLMRRLVQSLQNLEGQIQGSVGCDLNQVMILCIISEMPISSSEIAQKIGLLPAHTSKILSSIEDQHLIVRSFGKEDKRKVFFELTPEGHKKLNEIKSLNLEIPELIRPLMQ